MKTNILTLMLWGLLSLHMQAADGDTFTTNTIEGVEMTFKIISEADKTVQVGTGQQTTPAIAYSEISTALTIPDNVTYSNSSYSVVSIANYAFRDRTQISSVIIPDGVISIGENAFQNCTGLTYVKCGNSVTSIGSGAFYNCIGLSNIIFPNNLSSIGYQAFYGTSWYSNQADGVVYAGKVAYTYKGTMPDNTSVVLQEGTIGIANYAFRSCTNLSSITIPSTVLSIGSFAFMGCTDLTSIVIPDGVTTIQPQTFRGCTSLASITIPNSVVSIKISSLDETLWYTNQADGVVYAGKVAYKYKGTMPNNASITLIDGTLGIAYSAFSSQSNLSSITIPSSVTTIESNAFNNCSNLQHVISKAETPFTINSNAFSNISSACTLSVPYGTTAAYIAQGWTTDVFGGGIVEASAPSSNIAFADAKVKALCVAADWDTNNDGELSYTEAAAVTDLGNVFTGNTEITSFDELQYFIGLESIGHDAFNFCGNLTSVIIPSNIKTIEDNAFKDCSNLPSVILNEGLETISKGAFYHCTSLSSIIIPNSVTNFGSWDDFASYGIFSGCTSLNNVTLGSGMTYIPWSAFDGCTALESIVIPSNVKRIKGNAFCNCI